MSIFHAPIDPKHIKKERQKARELRQSQWWRQQLGAGRCYYCQQTFGKEDLTMDHVLPLARGGRTTKKNVVVSCKDCNSQKKYKTQVEWRMEQMSDSE